MRFYTSRAYQSIYSTGAQTSYNTFYILSHEERHRLADKIVELEAMINEKLKSGYFTIAKTKKGTLKNTTKSIYEICVKDLEALEFLKKLTFFTTFPESIMLDPTAHQIQTIVDKLLFKVVRKTFIHWLELYLSPDEVTPDEMRSMMEKKRKLFKRLQREGFIPPEATLNY